MRPAPLSPALSALVTAAAGLAALALAQCGGSTSSPRDAAADATSPGTDAESDAGQEPLDGASDIGCGFSCDASEDVTLVACPTSLPSLGAPCALPPQEECEYGASWWLGCNQLVRCTGGAWTSVNPAQFCAEPADAGADDAGACPATWAEASAVDAGPGLCPALGCQYPDGYCECLLGCGGGGAIRRPEIAGRWFCAPATPQCPTPRPELGTTCTVAEAGGSCQYGMACGCGEQLSCVDGVWQGYALPPCP